jgi:hypothetical protein
MRAMFTKDIVILLFFLSSGLTIFTLMAFDMGFDRAFAVPRFRLPEELITGWVLWGLLFGWAMGATDQIRGLSDYISHRGFSKARLYWTQHGLGLGAILVSITTPWILLALFGEGLYTADYVGVGKSWLLTSTVALPCYAVGVFLANLPLHFVLRVGLTFPLVFWIVGETPDRLLESGMQWNPGSIAMQFVLTGFVLLVAGYFGMLSGQDRDLPAPGTAFLPTLVLLVSVGWSLHALQSTVMVELTENMNIAHVAQRADGTFTLFNAEYDSESGRETYWEVDKDDHKRTVINDNLTQVDYAARYRARHAFSDGSKGYQIAGSGIAGKARRVSAYVSQEGKGILHLVERDIYNGTKMYLGKPSGPFSNRTRLFDPYVRNKRPVIWAGDPSDGTVWYADFGQEEWQYVALELPGEDRFEKWLEPNPGAGFGIAKAISGHEPRDSTFRLAFMQTTGGIMYVDRDTKQVTALTEEQMNQVSKTRTFPDTPRLHISKPGLIFQTSEVRGLDGEVLFTHDYSPSTRDDILTAGLTAIASVMHPPILAPKAFGNITHVQEGRRSISIDGVDPMQNPIRYASLQALARSRLVWTGFSTWSLVAWALLVGLAYGTRAYLIRFGATGPRLWIWPLAVMCFGVLGALTCVLIEPRRAYLPAVVDLGPTAPAPLLKSA